MKNKNWLIYGITATLLMGLWGAFTGLSANNGFPATLVYCVWALTMIIPALLILRRINWKVDTGRRAMLLGCAIGLLGAGGQMLLFYAVKVGPAYLIFPIISLSPVVTILMSLIFLKERTGVLGIIGIVLALSALPFFELGGSAEEGEFNIVWFASAVVVLLAWGIQAYFMKLANKSTTVESIFFYMMVTAVALIPVALFMTDFNEPINWNWDGPWLAAVVQVLNAIGALFLVYSFRYGKAIVVSPMTNAGAPLITTLFSMVVLNVMPDKYKIIGIGLAMLAAVLIVMEPEEKTS